jgi:ubiquinol oxidase
MRNWNYFHLVVNLATASVEAFSFCTHPTTRRARLATATYNAVKGTKEGTIESLQRQLDRQLVEIQETRRLLNYLNETKNETIFSNEHKQENSGVFGYDYGFISRSEGATSLLKSGGDLYDGPPGSLFEIGQQQFVRNLRAMVGEYRDEPNLELSSKQLQYRKQLNSLTLNTSAIWEQEGKIEAPFIIKVPYIAICTLLDVVFDGKYAPSRFFLLETVARMPYFSYISMIHLYETLGFWRRSADVKRIHFAEEINEYRHLLIMESLGGDQTWWVRFMAQHAAIVYFVVLCLVWALSPTLSYRFSELLETHAVHTYGVFLDENEEKLKKLPPSLAAVEYYIFGASDPFYAEFQTAALATGKDVR